MSEVLWTSWTGANSTSFTREQRVPGCSSRTRTTIPPAQEPTQGSQHSHIHTLGQTQQCWAHLGVRRGAEPVLPSASRTKGLCFLSPGRMLHPALPIPAAAHTWTRLQEPPGTSSHQTGSGQGWGWTHLALPPHPTFVPKNGFNFCWYRWDINEHKPKTITSSPNKQPPKPQFLSSQQHHWTHLAPHTPLGWVAVPDSLTEVTGR